MTEALRVAEDAPLTLRQRKAINEALEFASTDSDPVRRLLITVRAFFLHHTTRSYAAELGMRPHSLLDLEARGFDPERSVASVYGKFIVDWERRATLDPASAPFLTWASKRLQALVVAREFNTPLGQLIEWQTRFGSAVFAEKTGLDPAALSRYRENSTMLSFGDLVAVGSKLGLFGDASRSADSWNMAWVERARRISLRHSRGIERPLASAKLGMMLEWSGVPFTIVGVRQHFPGLKEVDAQKIIKYEPLKKIPLNLVLDSKTLVTAIPERDRDQLRQQMLQSHREFSRRPSPSKKIAEIVRARKMSTRYIAEVFDAIDPRNQKESISKVRDVVFRGAVVDDIPWGRIAGVVARSEREFRSLIALRASELSGEYRRRTGQRISASTLFRKIWGCAPGNDGTTVSDGISTPHQIAPLQRMMEVYLGRSPAHILGILHRAKQTNPLRHETGRGYERLRLIRQGQRVPSLPEFKTLLQAARIPFGPFHEIGWRDGLGVFRRDTEKGSEFGNAQRRILKTLIAEKAANTLAFLSTTAGVSVHERIHFQARGQGRELPLASFKRALTVIGVGEGELRSHTISLILQEKSFSRALRRWYIDGLIGADESVRSGMRELVSSKNPLTHGAIFCLPSAAQEILAVKFELESLAAETSEHRSVRRALMVRSLMRLFPGITIDEISEGVSSIRAALHALVRPTGLRRGWKPMFLNAADRRLIEDGLITADSVRRIGLPSTVRAHVRGLVGVLGTGVERAQSPMRIMFPASFDGCHPRVSEARVAMTSLFAETLHAMNVAPVVAAEVLKAFRGAWAVAHNESDSARVIGSFLDEVKVDDTESLTAIEVLDAALKELFAEYRK